MSDHEFYVYIANRMTGPPSEYLANLHEMSTVSCTLMGLGFVTINPAGDFLEGLMARGPIRDGLYKAHSLARLRLMALAPRRALLVVHSEHRDGRRSAGVHQEIEECQRLGVPIVRSIGELCQIRDAL